MSHRTNLPSYRSLLLRMWLENRDQRAAVWRFSLKDIESGELNGFADLDALICHLLELMEEASAQKGEQVRAETNHCYRR
ncbi:MAG: hypothetical protein DYG89_28050 [Caldilinea sp. CFX5]|nr:hypothetical protein [Caldilinea sp. CFX5]